MEYKRIKGMLEARGQAHLLRWWDELDAAARARLLEQIASVDWDTVALWNAPPVFSARGAVAPLPVLPRTEIEARRAAFMQAGRAAVHAGKVAAVLLAGGQGTRLGAHGPKGAVDIGITRPVSIFGRLMENLKEAARLCDVVIPLYIMTSEENDAATHAFFEENAYFGYPQQAVRFFRQQMGPCVDLQGKVLLEAKDRLAISPNGNGGWYTSLERAGLAREAESQGVEWFNVFAVDNVLQRMCDPLFVGATLSSGCATGAKVVRKACPEERVGVLCLENGLPTVIEYYDLSEELAQLRDERGELVYSGGVILNYLFRADVLKAIASVRLPVHVVKKKVPYLDESGVLRDPAQENAYKFETLILDMIRCAGSCLPFEVVREHEFAPVKNRTGTDSVESARKLLQKNGVEL